MKYFIAAVALVAVFSSGVMAQGTFNPVTKTGNLGNVDAGAVIAPYTNPVVPDTYEFINPKDVGLSKEDTSDVINVEKMNVFGQIKPNYDDTSSNKQK